MDTRILIETIKTVYSVAIAKLELSLAQLSTSFFAKLKLEALASASAEISFIFDFTNQPTPPGKYRNLKFELGVHTKQ